MAAAKVSGIYEIVNTVTGKRYVGSAVNLAHRWRQHRCELGKGRHNPILQNSWNKHGEAVFEFRVLEFVEDKSLLIGREQHYLDTLRPEYNVAIVAGSNFGVKWGADTLARMASANKRVWECPDHRRKMSAAHKGQKRTPEQSAKASAALRGRKLSPDHAALVAANNAARNRSPEHRARMSDFWKGRAKTPEQVAKMAEKKRGRPAHNRGVPLSDSQKAAQSESLKRRYAEDPGLRDKVSERTRAAMARPEVKAKVAAALLGRAHSKETKQRMAESQRRAWARRKASSVST